MKVVIKGLELQASVGIYDSEKTDTQRIVFNIELETTKPLEDNIEHTVSYETVISEIKTLVNAKHYELLETLAFDINDVLKKDTRIIGGFIEILKPDIFDDADFVGVRIKV